MDKSELFIKQCDCEEIQGYRKKQKDFQVGDYIANHTLGPNSKAMLLEVVAFEQFDEIRHPQLAVWLPMQHQIQGMMGFKYAGPGYVRELWDFTLDESEVKAYDSFEQLWLAFYFHKKHSKRWDSKEEKWAKE